MYGKIDIIEKVRVVQERLYPCASLNILNCMDITCLMALNVIV